MSGQQRVRRVVIAGGGTAGWLAATVLARQLGQMLDITLIESDEIGTIGVGESTIPTARSFHALAGIDEAAFVAATGSTFKLGIRFEDWGRIGERYFHAFGEIGRSTWMAHFSHFWLAARNQGIGGPLGDYCLELKAAEAMRFSTDEDGGATLNYAYHLDAGRYARFLRTHAEAQGAIRIEGRIADVELDPDNGDIAALRLQSGERIEGDLFLDCTGFRGLLIEQALGAGWEDWSRWLPNDSALALQTRAVAPPLPYTRAIAHSAGWRWEIPLQHRVGNGLVYACAHLSDDEAHDCLLAAVTGETLIEPRLIRFQTGRRKRQWLRNCIAFGLSSGFVEPLESTSIHLVMIGLTRLLQLFPFDGCDPALADRYNAQADTELARIRDFIVLHYKLTNRDDSAYWRDLAAADVPDSLAERIALFAETGQAYQAVDELFRVDSWVQVMLGQGVAPRTFHRAAQMMEPARLADALDSLSGNIARAVAALPTHQAFIERYCPSPL
jgi:tryptophan halogenase